MWEKQLCGTKTVVRQTVALQSHSGAGIHSAGHWGPTDGTGGYTLRKATDCGEPMQEQAPGRISGPLGDPHWSSLCLKDCTTWKEPIPGQFLYNWNLGKDAFWSPSWSIRWVGIHTKAGEFCVYRKEWERQGFLNWPKPLFPMHLHGSGEGGRRNISEIEPGKKGVAGWKCLKFCFISHYLILLQLIGNKLNYFPQGESVFCDGNW